ncbi:hypothetical protein [Microcystis phage Mwe-Yong1]|nr:hypothetical protein [Microcystis phage Mwe-Yong1]
MKRRDIHLIVSDHAVLRYLERGYGIDIEAIRRHLAGLATSAAELGATAVQVERLKVFLRTRDENDGSTVVIVSTVQRLSKRRRRLAEVDDD